MRCFVPVLTALLVLGAFSERARAADAKVPQPRAEQTTDSSRQIVGVGANAKARGALVHVASDLRECVLSGLNQPRASYPLARPILIVLNPSQRSTMVPQIQIVEDPGGLKLQVDVSPEMDPAGVLFQRTIIHALLVELSLRAQSNTKADFVPEPPRWMVDALLHKFRFPDTFLAIDSLRPFLDAGRMPSLGTVASRLERDPAPSSPQDESVARCLLALLAGQSDSRSGMRLLLQGTVDESNAVSRILRAFPSLGSSESELQKVWTLHLAALGTQRERVVLTGPQTLKELGHLLELELTDPAGNHEVYPIEQFSDYMRLSGIRSILTARQLEFNALQVRGHFFYSEAIRIYAQVCGELAKGRTVGQAALLRKAGDERDKATAQLEKIRDYMNWYEAEELTKTRNRFEEIYRMWGEMEPIPKNPFISRALDEWEKRLHKESEDADVERALRESRARSKSQR